MGNETANSKFQIPNSKFEISDLIRTSDVGLVRTIGSRFQISHFRFHFRKAQISGFKSETVSFYMFDLTCQDRHSTVRSKGYFAVCPVRGCVDAHSTDRLLSQLEMATVAIVRFRITVSPFFDWIRNLDGMQWPFCE